MAEMLSALRTPETGIEPLPKRPVLTVDITTGTFRQQADSIIALARSGVGALTLVDLDEVCLSNVNRQLPALDGTIGRFKAEVLAERALAINPTALITNVGRGSRFAIATTIATTIAT